MQYLFDHFCNYIDTQLLQEPVVTRKSSEPSKSFAPVVHRKSPDIHIRADNVCTQDNISVCVPQKYI